MSLAWTWPLGAHLSSTIPHDPGDHLLNTWILWWNAQALPFTPAWWNAPILYPLQGSLALSEHLLGISVFTTPLQLAGAPPIVAYNVALLLSFGLSAFFMYLLALRLTSSQVAAVCAGIAFGFAPYRAGQLSHLQVLTSQWLPLMLLGLHGYVSDGRRAWLALFGAAWLLQALANGYYMLFAPVLVVLWVAYFVNWREAPSRGGMILVAWMLASLPLVPIVLGYRDVHDALGLARTPVEIRQFSATAASFLQPPPLLAVWPSGTAGNQEQYLFPGVVAPALVLVALIGLAWRRQPGAALRGREPLLFYSLATLVMYALALGPGRGDAVLSSVLHPYRWLLWLPGFDSLRVPARFAMLGTVCLATSVAFAVARLRPALTGSVRAGLAALVIAGLVLDGVTDTIPIAPPPTAASLTELPPGPVIELPLDDPRVSAAAMYRAMLHRRPLVNGYTGHTPQHYAKLSQALRRGDAAPLHDLARGQSLIVVIDRASDADGRFRRMVMSLPGIRVLDETQAGEMFVVPGR